MHASIACLLLYEDYVWVSLGNAMKAKQSKDGLDDGPARLQHPTSHIVPAPGLTVPARQFTHWVRWALLS
jgi:hypothetical protein